MKLNELEFGEKAVIKSLDLSLSSAQRLIEIGFANDTEVSLEIKGISPYLKAYRIKNTVIALRDKTAERITVELL